MLNNIFILTNEEIYNNLKINDILSERLNSLLNKFTIDIEKIANSRITEDTLTNKNKFHSMIKNKAEKYLTLGDYNAAIQTFQTLIDYAKGNNDNILTAKAKEGLAISLFLNDLFQAHRNIKEIKFNADIESNYENIIVIFKKMKINEFYIEYMFKLCIYYSLFPAKMKNFLEISKKITEELNGNTSIIKFNSLLKLQSIYSNLGFYRKAALFLFA